MRTAVLSAALLLTACSASSTVEESQSPSPIAGAPTLRAMVGTQESPNAFEISLVDSEGNPVTEIPAGKYNIEVVDNTDIHDYHLSSTESKDVDEKTGVTEMTTTTWALDLTPGKYRYMCDPHPSMRGEFTVT